eukprot:15460525-Alexandrium_andersonii.AAC.1
MMVGDPPPAPAVAAAAPTADEANPEAFTSYSTFDPSVPTVYERYPRLRGRLLQDQVRRDY